MSSSRSKSYAGMLSTGYSGSRFNCYGHAECVTFFGSGSWPRGVIVHPVDENRRLCGLKHD